MSPGRHLGLKIDVPTDKKVIDKAVRERLCIQLIDQLGTCPIKQDFTHLFTRPKLPSVDDVETPRWCSAQPCTCQWRTVPTPEALRKIADRRNYFAKLEEKWTSLSLPNSSTD